MAHQQNTFPDLLLGMAVMLAVRDLEVSIKFYQDNFGFHVLHHEVHIAALRLNNMQMYLFTHSPPTPDKPGVTLTNNNQPDKTSVVLDLFVSDCEAAYALLHARGVHFLTPPYTPPWGGRRCFARDPDDYLIELEEHPDIPFLKD